MENCPAHGAAIVASAAHGSVWAGDAESGGGQPALDQDEAPGELPQAFFVGAHCTYLLAPAVTRFHLDTGAA